ncbi:MAG TPA: DMT family transporter [Bacteroidales bacterium]|nr:DMT family transporter [Bacteroidales bacterium]
MNKRSNTIFLAILTCLLWSTVYALIKTGLKYDTPLFFAGKRFILSGVILLPFAGRLTEYASILKNHSRVFIQVTLLQIILNYILFYWGMNLVPGALGAIIVGSQPLVTALVAAAITDDNTITRKKISVIIAGIAGVILISTARQVLRLGSASEILGVILIMGANIATSVSNVIVSVRSKGANPVVLNAMSLITGGLVIFLLAAATEKPAVLTDLPAEYWLTLMWLGFTSAIGFSTWYKLLQRPEVKVSELNLWKFIIPVFGAIISWMVVPEEKPDVMTVTGIIIISSSLVFFFRGIKGRTLDRHINK